MQAPDGGGGGGGGSIGDGVLHSQGVIIEDRVSVWLLHKKQKK